MDQKLTEFNYLLNRMEHAGRQETPADHHYGTHRASLLRHVRALEKDAARYRWLRAQTWDRGPLAVVANPKDAIKLGHDAPSLFRLDEAIDVAMAAAPAAGAA